MEVKKSESLLLLLLYNSLAQAQVRKINDKSQQKKFNYIVKTWCKLQMVLVVVGHVVSGVSCGWLFVVLSHVVSGVSYGWLFVVLSHVVSGVSYGWLLVVLSHVVS